MNIKVIFISIILGAMSGLGSSYFVMNKQISNINERLIQTPPIVIVDFAKMASHYPDGASQKKIDEMMVKTNNAIIKLKKAGYLVLDSGAVVSAPSDIYLPEEIIK